MAGTVQLPRALERRSRFSCFLLSTALTGCCGLLAAPPSAVAGCDANTTGTSLCTGSDANIAKIATGDLTVQFDNQTVTNGVFVTANGGAYDVGLIVNSASGNPITSSSGGAITVASGGGDVFVTTVAGAPVASTAGSGLFLQTSGTGNIAIVTGDTVSNSPGGNAIAAYAPGTGRIDITTNADVSGVGGNAIAVDHRGASGEIRITTAATSALSGATAVWVSASGGANLAVTQNGAITADSGYYVDLQNGTATLNIGNDITGLAGTGVSASTNTGSITVNMTGGTLSSAYDGLYLTSMTGAITVDMTGGRIGTASTPVGTNGINVVSGAGNVDIMATQIYAVDYGIVVQATSGTNNITVPVGGIVRADTGIFGYSSVGTTITNAGTIAGTGGTAIRFDGSGNALVLAPTGTIIGNVVGGAGIDTLKLGGSGAGTFDVGTIGSTAQYQNFDAFAKTGDFTWSLTGTNPSTMAWTVDAGTLAVNATLADATFTVSGGTLMGSGTIGGLGVTGGGTVAPGNSIGTLTVAGNISFAAGSIYQVEINAAGQSDKIEASGTATISGGTVDVVAASGSYGASTIYTILSATGGVTGTFSDVTSDLAFLTPTLSYDFDEVFLTLTRNSTSFATVAGTVNQRAAAAALDASVVTSPLVQALLPLSTAGARQAFDALSGELHADVAGVLAQQSVYMRQAMLGRLRQFPADATPALAAGGPELEYAQPMPAKPHPMADLAAGAVGAGSAWWVQGFGSWGTADSDGNAAALSRRIAGVATGVDAPLGQSWRAGLAGGYSQSTVNAGARSSSATVDSAHLGLYAGGPLGAVNLRAGAAVAWHAVDSDRTVTFSGFSERDTARYDAVTAQVFGEVGYAFTLDKVALEPFAGLAGVVHRSDGFTETGTTSTLAAAGGSDSFVYASLGIRAATTLAWNGMTIVPHASAAWQHAVGDVTPTSSFTFVSTGTPFTTAGLPLARDTALIEAGADLRLRSGVTVGLAYVGQVSADARDNAVKGRFAWAF